ncbi:MAG: hypothetical protein QOH70_3781 [Blastocatellia bacterium]|nr:hypothetical protein [Blastocatellia bacterium]
MIECQTPDREGGLPFRTRFLQQPRARAQRAPLGSRTINRVSPQRRLSEKDISLCSLCGALCLCGENPAKTFTTEAQRLHRESQRRFFRQTPKRAQLSLVALILGLAPQASCLRLLRRVVANAPALPHPPPDTSPSLSHAANTECLSASIRARGRLSENDRRTPADGACSPSD